jgi:hypothetical protein
MANNKIYTKVEIEAIKEGLSHYFPYELGETSGPRVVDDNWSDINKIFKWHGRDDFFTTLSEATGIQKLSFTEIKGASNTLEKMEGAAPETVEFKGAKEGLAPTTPNKETISEDAIRKNEQKIAKTKAATEKSNQEARDAIKRQQEIYAEQIQKAKVVEAALKNKKIYYKVEKAPLKDSQEVRNLKEQAKANPQEYIKDATNQFSNNPNLKNLSKAEAEIVSKQAAVTSYEVLTDNSPLIQSVIISRVASDPKILDSISNPETREYFKNAAELLTTQKLSQYELSKQLLNFSKIDGHENINDLKIEFSSTPQPGFKEFDFNDRIIAPHIENLNQQNLFLDSLESFGEGEIKSRILLSVGNKLTSYISTLPTDSLLAQTYNSELVQLGLSSLGVVESVPWVAVEGSFVGKFVVGSGLAPVAGFIQTKTGIDLGIKVVAKEVGKQTVEKGLEVAGKAVVTGGEVAAKGTVGVGVAAGITAAFAWTGPLAPIIGAIGSFLVSTVATKAVVAVGGFLKDKAQKYGKYLVAGVGAGFGLLIGGGSLLGAVIGGAIGFGGAVAFSGGVPALGAAATSFGSGVLTFFGAIAGATLGAIGGPILGFLLGFPLMVALILFIINSGAYIVPPSPISLSSGEIITSPYIEVTKTATPSGPFQNSELPLTVEYQITIRAKKGTLSNVIISYDCNVIKKSGSIECPETMPAMPAGIQIPNNTISPASVFEFSYKQTYDVNFEDSLITDTLTVTADTPEQSEAEAAASAGIKIGNPPDSCPAGWPVSGQWVITQTPGGSFSHSSVEAIDIATYMGTPVQTTHSGIAKVVYTSNAYAPVYVTISSNCGGKDIESWYAHLSAVTVANGQQVTMGQIIGATGTGGTGPHLHYEFRNLRMDMPYIPKSIQRGCSSNAGCGSVP